MTQIKLPPTNPGRFSDASDAHREFNPSRDLDKIERLACHQIINEGGAAMIEWARMHLPGMEDMKRNQEVILFAITNYTT